MSKICDNLDRSKSWYYDTLASREQVMQQEQLIVSEVKKIQSINTAYGIRKVKPQLARNGIEIGRDRLNRIMGKYGLLQPKRYKKVRTSFPGMYDRGFENLLKGLDVDHKDLVWCTDITYIFTTEGILYVSAMMDIYSRKIIGYNISNNLRTDGALACLEQALKQKTNTKGIIHHSDHGVQYCSGRYLEKLTKNGMLVSFTGKDHCYDNAKMERFFNTLKHEYGLKSVIKSKRLAIEMIKKAIDNYNYIRLHAALNYNTPGELYDVA